jgi:protein TonB
MQYSFPSYNAAHVLAVLGVVGLHTGLAAWATAPEPPMVIPQQQIIHVSMVAPTIIQQKTTSQPKQEVEKVPVKLPPKAKGMVKTEPKPEVEKEEKVEKKKESAPIIQQASAQLTSGQQALHAKNKNSAITKPAAADYLKNPPPEYPHRARERKEQGTVLLDVCVTVEGSPRTVEVQRSSGHHALDQAALDAVKHWRFVPARRGSKLVEANVVVPIQFRIN